jgi:putative flippase GtrA
MSSATSRPSAPVAAWLWLRKQAKPFLKFGIVGGFSALVDIGLFNLLLLDPDFGERPLLAKTISVAISTVTAWLGNRFWTFRGKHRKDFWVELLEYALVALGGLGIALGFLWISHYVLGFTSLLADNISANVLGLAAATAFRYLLNVYWVFGESRSHNVDSTESTENA